VIQRGGVAPGRSDLLGLATFGISREVLTAFKYLCSNPLADA
jgi:hypothetical protein